MRRASGRAGLLRWGAVALYAGIAASLAPPARAAEAADAAGPTFTRDVAPIVHRRCAECHRPGDVAPMSLLTYDEARPWAKAIQKAVVSREMPPWDADPAVGRWSNDISLAKEEIETIVAWVDAGAPQGDPAELPPLPTWSRGWRLGEPDAILELPSFDVPAQGADRFPSIFVELGNQERKYVRAVELHIGERSVLHHMVLFQGPLAMTQDIVDLRSPENRRGRLADTPKLLYVWAAGSPPVEFPEGIGHVLEPNQVLTLNMHYHPGGAAAKDASSLGLYFTDEPPRKELQTAVAIKSSLRVPAGSRDAEDTAWFLFPQDSLMLSFLPHMHQRGAAIRYTLHYPDGTDEVGSTSHATTTTGSGSTS